MGLGLGGRARTCARGAGGTDKLLLRIRAAVGARGGLGLGWGWGER